MNVKINPLPLCDTLYYQNIPVILFNTHIDLRKRILEMEILRHGKVKHTTKLNLNIYTHVHVCICLCVHMYTFKFLEIAIIFNTYKEMCE